LLLPYNRKLNPVARDLRKNMTDAERLIWSRLRRRQIKGHQFYRQKIIGEYIVDFFCPTARLVIEVDGGQHCSADGIKKDKVRDDHLEGVGLAVLRFSDTEVLKNIEGVLEGILEVV
jgi:very-short-patch-repair endonuclease